MDSRRFLHFTIYRNQSYYWTHSQHSLSLKAKWQKSIMNCLSFLQLCVKRIVRKKFSSLLSHHCFSLEHMTSKQQAAIKSSIFDANSHLNGIFLSFDSLNKEFHLENRLVNSFSNCFSFYKADCSPKERKSHHCSCLDNIVLNTLFDPLIVIIVSDTSIKNNVTMSIAHIHLFSNPLEKTLYHTIKVMSTEEKLFAIKCEINQATQISDTSHIIIITNALYTTQRIFDSTKHPYQIQAIAIFKYLQRFFKEHLSNSVKF